MSAIPETRDEQIERLLASGTPASEVFGRAELHLRRLSRSCRRPVLTRAEFAERMRAEVRAGRVRMIVPEVGEA